MNKKKNIYKAILTSTVVVPAMGIVAHLMPHKGMFWQDDASLLHRAECAYILNPQDSVKTYTSYEYNPSSSVLYNINGALRPVKEDGSAINDAWIEPGVTYDKYCHTEKYLAHPYMTYPLHILVAMGAYAYMRRRKQNDIYQKTR